MASGATGTVTGTTPARRTAAELTVTEATAPALLLTPWPEQGFDFKFCASTGDAPAMPAVAYGLCTVPLRILAGEVRGLIGLIFSVGWTSTGLAFSKPSFLVLLEASSKGPSGLADRASSACTGALDIRAIADLCLLGASLSGGGEVEVRRAFSTDI